MTKLMNTTSSEVWGKSFSLAADCVGGYPFQREVSRNALARRVTPFDPPSASLEESRRGVSNHVTACPMSHTEAAGRFASA
jgi:hypothetical protein